MKTEQDKTLEALQIAIRMEINGKEYYLKASRESSNELGRKLLKSLATEEDAHRQKFEGIYRVTFNPPAEIINNVNSLQGIHAISENYFVPYRLYNIGNSSPVKLTDFIFAIEKNLGKEARKELMEMQPGDVPKTWADTTDLEQDIDYKPDTSIEVGVKKFIEWFREYFSM